MILTLQVQCVWGWGVKEPCIRVIEIDEQASLFGLHDAIQDAVGFDRDHLFHFFLANSESTRAQRHWLSDAEDYEDWYEEFRHLPLGNIWPLKRKKLYYLFDFGDQWTFEIRKRRGAKEPEPGVSYPQVIEQTGPDPKQY